MNSYVFLDRMHFFAPPRGGGGGKTEGAEFTI